MLGGKSPDQVGLASVENQKKKRIYNHKDMKCQIYCRNSSLGTRFYFEEAGDA